MIRVLVVDDQVVVSEGLRVLLNASPHIEVIAVADNGLEAVSMTRQLTPDIVLMDLKMPQMNGIQATRAITDQHKNIPVLILTTYDDDEWVLEAVRAGAKGYLLKDSDRNDIIAAIEGTIAGKTHVDPAVAQKLFTFIKDGTPANADFADSLSERELAILRLLANGMTNAAIADRLFLAEGTVRNHVSSILAKLGVTDRAQATALAWRYGLITPQD
ncbi:MAG: response regulator transcription factor [Aggregatilineales bacterium]